MKRLLLVALALAAVVAPSATASETTPFAATVTEDFCAPRTTCGTAVGRFGHADVRTVITAFVPLPSGCFLDRHTTTLTFEDGGTLALAIEGTLCPGVQPGTFRFEGTFTLAGGTGTFAGATGGGTVRAFREQGPIHAILLGEITL